MIWPFRRKPKPPPYELVTDGEKYAIRNARGEWLTYYPTLNDTEFYPWKNLNHYTWMDKEIAEIFFRRLMAGESSSGRVAGQAGGRDE